MVTVTIKNIVPATPPTGGWKVEYRIKGTTGAYITASGSPYMSQPIAFDTTDPVGTLYEGKITAMCTANSSTEYFWATPCDCSNAGSGSGGFIPSADGKCVKTDQITPVLQANACFGPKTHPSYGGWGTRIYNLGWTASSLYLDWGTTGGIINTNLTTYPQWKGSDGGVINGPVNRDAIWIDSDCNGSADNDTAGASATASLLYDNSAGPSRQIYLGVAGDNQFILKLNGLQLVNSYDGYNATKAQYPFKIWHLLPIVIPKGLCLFNLQVDNAATGSSPSALAMVLYDNTIPQLAAATDDSQLNIKFKTRDLISTTPTPISTCPDGWSLSTDGAHCLKATYDNCNEQPPLVHLSMVNYVCNAGISTFDIIGDAGATLKVSLLVHATWNWDVAGSSVLVKAQITSPSGMNNSAFSTPYPQNTLSGSYTVDTVSLTPDTITLDSLGKATITVTASVQLASPTDTGNSAFGKFVVESVNGSPVVASQTICVRFLQ